MSSYGLDGEEVLVSLLPLTSARKVNAGCASYLPMYREMDMRFWLEQAEAIMGALP